MASGHLTIDLHTQGQPPGCLPLGPRLAPRLAPGSPPPRRERGRSLFPSVLSEGNRLHEQVLREQVARRADRRTPPGTPEGVCDFVATNLCGCTANLPFCTACGPRRLPQKGGWPGAPLGLKIARITRSTRSPHELNLISPRCATRCSNGAAPGAARRLGLDARPEPGRRADDRQREGGGDAARGPRL